jgi:hypothetical protein
MQVLADIKACGCDVNALADVIGGDNLSKKNLLIEIFALFKTNDQANTSFRALLQSSREVQLLQIETTAFQQAIEKENSAMAKFLLEKLQSGTFGKSASERAGTSAEVKEMQKLRESLFGK